MSADAGVREGDIIAGKYRIDRVLGAGAMGVVVAAHHLKLDERVAIKFLQPEALANAEAVVRFEREARAAVRIKSEHVARVLDVGTLENGAPYMVMEHLEGIDLAAWLQERGPIPIAQAVEFVLQALEAIAEAHRLGIVHRDLKPANLFVVRRADGLDAIKVLDFGISKLSLTGEASFAAGQDEMLAGERAEKRADHARHESMSMTRTATAMGSPFYMSPEQIQSARDVDARTDIWAIGITLWELLTGKVPFGATTMPELCMRICTAPLPPLRERWPDAPAGLERVIARCLEKDRRQRYPNVAELAAALGEFGPRRARSSVERIVRTISGSALPVDVLDVSLSSDAARRADEETSIAPLGRTASGAKSRKTKNGRIAAAGVMIVLSAGLVVNAWIRQPSTDAPAPGASAPPSFGAVGVREGEPRDVPDAAAATLDAMEREAIVAEPPLPPPRSNAPPKAPSPKRPPAPSAPVKPSGATSVKQQGPECDPPFTFDDKGRKHFKPECYR
jgi:serine/threonine protein kinase